MDGRGRLAADAALVGLAALSLALRLFFWSGTEVQETLRADASHYTYLAWSLANRGMYEDPTSPGFPAHLRWPPGYPTLLAPFFRARAQVEGAAVAQAVQVVVGAALPVLVVVLGRHFLSGSLAILAGLLTACCPVMVTTPAFLASEMVFTLLLVTTLLAMLAVVERPSVTRAGAVGLLSGVVSLVRSDFQAIPWVAALYLAVRSPGPDRRRAALALALSAAVMPAAWQVHQHLAADSPVDSYFARPFAEGIYPDLVFGNSVRGYAMLADPAFPEFSHSISATLAEAWRRARTDPWPSLKWNLVGRWLTLWEFHMIQSPPIHIYPVRHGLFRPAFINPAGKDEPLAWVYWLFRVQYWAVVALVLVGVVRAVRARRAPSTPGRRAVEVLYLLLASHVVLHSIVIPEPRFMLPVRPILFLLALATAADLLGREPAPARDPGPARGTTWALVGVFALVAAVVVADPDAVRARLQPDSLDAVRFLERQGRFAEAAATCERVLASDPANADAAMAAGLLDQYHLGDPARAVEQYRTVLRLVPTHYGAHYQLAVALLAAGREAEARAAWFEFVPLAERAGDRETLDRAPAALRGP
ncbi:MAG TPA: tetratricopeptide repeat protein [Candidatus Binatia bacterium]|nr:tetratricopeptide repeat protein [Candidatus Binatia bacterium]